MEQAALILEGGANRGIFTAGVLDFLMDQDFRASYVVGVSAGACNALGYVSEQRGRTRDCILAQNEEKDKLEEMKRAARTDVYKRQEYFCVDNLPIPLVEKFARLALEGGSGEISKVAVGLDVRSGQSFEQLSGVLDVLRAEGIDHEILFLDAKDQVLVKRYKETRRNHPLDRTGRVDVGIARELSLIHI